jgi:cytidylate kinase
MKRRDEIDSQRSLAPLKPANDAIIISTDGKNREQVIKEILNLINLK